MKTACEIRAERCFASRRINLYGFVREFVDHCETKHGYIAIYETRNLAPLDAAEPFGSISDDEAQALIDDLWRCGLRPTEGAGSAGAMSATQAHLADMRRMVEKAFKVEFK